MSNSVTNVEIEDVLSSIRRLVSDGESLRGIASLQASQPSEPDATTAKDAESHDPSDTRSETPVRFVLTAAHRVDESEPEAPVIDAEQQAEEIASVEDAEELTAPEILWTSDDVPADDDALLYSDDSPAEADLIEAAAEPQVEPLPDWVSAGEAELDALEAREQGLPEQSSDQLEDIADASLTPETEPDPEDGPLILGAAEPIAEAAVGDDGMRRDGGPEKTDTNRQRLANTIAELEAAIGGQAYEWEPDGSEEAPVMDWDSAGEDVIFSSRLSGLRKDAPPPRGLDAAPDEQADETEAFGQAAFEEAEAPSEPATSDDEAEIIEETPGVRSAPDVMPSFEDDDYDIDDDDEALASQLTAFLEQDDVLDEATLRRMVAEIVHEELQGPLGERITRNVRKLVRREISQALARRDFD